MIYSIASSAGPGTRAAAVEINRRSSTGLWNIPE